MKIMSNYFEDYLTMSGAESYFRCTI